MSSKLFIIGLSESGCADLSSRAFNAMQRSHCLIGSSRFLEFFSNFPGKKIPLSSPLSLTIQKIPKLLELGDVTFLASGDPLCFGVGGLLVKKFGRKQVEIVPNLSSLQWACAKTGITWQDADFYSAHGRPLMGLVSRLQFSQKLICFTDNENTPQKIAQHLLSFHETSWDFWVCEELNGPEESIRCFSVEEAAQLESCHHLNLVILKRKGPLPVIDRCKPETAFAKRTPILGLITKQEIRAIVYSKMSIQKTDIIWDVGAGSGAVGIEAAQYAYLGKSYGIELNEESIEHCIQNQIDHKVDNYFPIHGRAPDALSELPRPHAIFIGGSKGNLRAILDLCFDKLLPGGRLVVNTVTLNTTNEASDWMMAKQLTPELSLINISRGVPLAKKYLKYEALNPIHCFTIRKNKDENNVSS